MPTVPRGGKVLVSGANGYIAMWTVKILLQQGYRVRGTVRSAEKGKFMSDYFAKLGYGEAFEFVIVQDIIKDGAFDEVVKDVDAIEHMASPVHFNPGDPQGEWYLCFYFSYLISLGIETLKPAIQGTVSMLKSAMKNGTKVKRIVITSSTAAIASLNLDLFTEPRIFSERDWNEASPKEVEELGSKASAVTVYRASKSLAERAAWDFYNEHKAQVQWDLTVINPPGVFGPPIHDVTSPKSLNLSLQVWYDMVASGSPKTKEALSQSPAWVDVRDTALAHVLALNNEAAGAERILTVSDFEGVCYWQKWIDTVNNLKPNPHPSHKFIFGYPEIAQEKVVLATLDKSKEERIFGIKFKTMEETAKDTLEDFARRGW
ncbi:hypothetical protein NLJ89_g748 [Agrocybe chaxingu]|uniref:NAD-dependent epimerase/dehydratase domain-containing protein n=1 Tax=Agrocybe chaxingu TaxID=84603 RepID=A0A9W8N1H0_9AGAR|nr:hypothetical protein NLJ89_g748 [Agrocybe chaxingu]